jgi:hypothetical protein
VSVLIPIIGAAIVRQGGGVNYAERAEEFQARAEELKEVMIVLRSNSNVALLQDCVIRSEFILRPRLKRNLEELEIPV